MPQPDEVARLAQQLIDLFVETQNDLNRRLASAASERSRARLRQLQAAISDALDSLEADAAAWFSDAMPRVYGLGGAAGAASIGDEFTWSQFHVDAVQQLAQQTYAEVLQATRFVRVNVKTWIRQQARTQTAAALLEGRTAQQAARALAKDALAREVLSVTYRNGARHTIADYADTLIRTTTANAYNAGTLNHLTGAGVEYVEVLDGAGCGWTSHDDGDKANGSVRPIREAMLHSLSHPRCRRAFSGRPDVTSAKEAANARSLRTPEQLAAQAAAESERAAGIASRAAGRRGSGGASRAQRTPRTSRSSTPTPRQPRTQRSAPPSQPASRPTPSTQRPTLEATSTRRAPKLDDLLDNFQPGDSVLERMRPVFERRYGALNVELDDARRSTEGILVRGRIWDGRTEVGRISREIRTHADGTRSVYNALLTVDDRYQGQGFVSAYFDDLESWYRANGISYIDVHANIDVGGYAWATKGFDWQKRGGEPDMGNVPTRLAREIAGLARGPERDAAQAILDRMTDPTAWWTDRMVSPSDIAELGRRPGMGRDDIWLGKRALLNSSWHGRKAL